MDYSQLIWASAGRGASRGTCPLGKIKINHKQSSNSG